MVELKVKGSITELISRLLGKTSSEKQTYSQFQESSSIDGESQDRTLQSTVEQNHEDPVHEMVEQLVKLPKIVPRRNPGSADCGGSTVAVHQQSHCCDGEGHDGRKFLAGQCWCSPPENGHELGEGVQFRSLQHSVRLVWRDVKWRPLWVVERRDCRYPEAVDERNERRFANSREGGVGSEDQ